MTILSDSLSYYFDSFIFDVNVFNSITVCLKLLAICDCFSADSKLAYL